MYFFKNILLQALMNVGYKPYNYKFFNCSGTVLQYQKVHFFFKSTAQQNFWLQACSSDTREKQSINFIVKCQAETIVMVTYHIA